MKKLNSCKVLVTRPKTQSERLCQLLKTAGAEAIAFPTLHITPSDHITKIKLQELLSWATHIVFISRNAVTSLDQQISNISNKLVDKLLFATGKGTMQALEKIGIESVLYPKKEYGSVGLLQLEAMSSKNIKGKNLLIIRGEEGRELLREGLQARGAKVEYACIYASNMPKVSAELIDSIWSGPIPDIIVVTSNQGLQNLIKMTPENYKGLLFSRKLVVMSSRIADTASNAGFVSPSIIAENQSDEGLIEAIRKSLEQEQNDNR